MTRQNKKNGGIDSSAIGAKHGIDVTVTPEMRPVFEGIAEHPLYATWSMVHDMEIACRQLLDRHLGADKDSFGVSIEVQHLAPVAVGKTVRVTAEIHAIEGRMVTFEVRVHDGARMIGTGRHSQVIVARSQLHSIYARA